MAKNIAQIDTTIDIVTPENIAFHYRVAGPFRRLPAYFVDLLVRAAIFGVLVWMGISLAAFLGAMVFAALIICWFILDWFYGGLFETFMNGQTPGKWVMGVRVLTVDGQPINGMQAVMRNILRFADMMPLLSLQMFGAPTPVHMVPTFVLGLVVMSLNSKFQRLGDLVCGTMVVIEERQWLQGVAALEDPRCVQLASYLPLDFQVSRTLARALATYVERRRYFSASRRREVARHLAQPLLHRFGLPSDTSYDLLLCALYYRTFIADRGEEPWEEAGISPFAGGPSAHPLQATPAAARPIAARPIAARPWSTPPADGGSFPQEHVS